MHCIAHLSNGFGALGHHPVPTGHLSQQYCSCWLRGWRVYSLEGGWSAPGSLDCKRVWKSSLQPKASALPVHGSALGRVGVFSGPSGTLTQFSWGSDQGQCSACWLTGQPCLGRHKEGTPGICRYLLIDLKGTSQPILAPSCHLSPIPWWAPQTQLRTMLEVTRQQATQAESQLQELQQRSNQIQVQACLSPTCLHVVSFIQSAGPWDTGWQV